MKAHRLLPLIPAVALVGSGWFANRLEIGRQAKIPVVLTHHKAVGRHGWGKSVLTLAMVDSARRAGTDVMIDQYPYTASYTGLDVLVPPWALAGGSEALRGRLANPALRDSIRRGVLDLILNDRGGADLKRVQFARVGWDPSLQGKTLADWAVRRGLPPPGNRDRSRPRRGVEGRGGHGVSCDRRGRCPADHGPPSDDDCERRRAEVGTFTDPHHYPSGISWVFVNGEPVVANGAMTPARPGRVIRRPQ